MRPAPFSILMLHEVIDDREPATRILTNPGTEITVSFLSRMIRNLEDQGVSFLSLDDLLLRARLPAEATGKTKRFVCLTFDDGFSNVYTNAYPVLEQHRVPFCVYVTTGYPDRTICHVSKVLEDYARVRDEVSFRVGGKCRSFDLTSPTKKRTGLADIVRWLFGEIGEIDSIRACLLEHGVEVEKYDPLGLSWAQLEELSRDPLVTIGAHTLTHPDLTRSSRDVLENELRRSKLLLERRLGRPVVHFAYPYGSYGDRERRAVIAAGYASATSTRDDCVDLAVDDVFALPRVNVTYREPNVKFGTFEEVARG